ncbi:MAG: hypothetical protein KF752_09295 [Pirellulaceae bacterium]|nr:hypothetical protein [Pirellulaceae bacterium]
MSFDSVLSRFADQAPVRDVPGGGHDSPGCNGQRSGHDMGGLGDRGTRIQMALAYYEA